MKKYIITICDGCGTVKKCSRLQYRYFCDNCYKIIKSQYHTIVDRIVDFLMG